MTRVRLFSDTFRYLSATPLASVGAEEWGTIQDQRRKFLAEITVPQLIAMLKAGEDLPSYGYELNNYQHCLQTATMMASAGYEGEDIVVGLLHDIAFAVAPDTHGAVAAALLDRRLSARNRWMLEYHAEVGQRYLPGDSGSWRDLADNPWFAWTDEFVERFDLRAVDASRPISPIEAFEPLLRDFYSGKTGGVQEDPTARCGEAGVPQRNQEGT